MLINYYTGVHFIAFTKYFDSILQPEMIKGSPVFHKGMFSDDLLLI